jgi:hypothetical protein
VICFFFIAKVRNKFYQHNHNIHYQQAVDVSNQHNGEQQRTRHQEAARLDLFLANSITSKILGLGKS